MSLFRADKGKKPQGYFRLNRNHPLAKGLVICQVTFDRDLISGVKPDLAGSIHERNEIEHNDTNDRTFLESTNDEVIGFDEVSIVLGYEKTDATNRNSAAFGFTSTDASTRCGALLPYGTGTVYWDFGSATTTGRVSVAGLSFGDDNWCFIASNSNTTRKIYQNGALKAENNTASATRTDSNTQFLLGKHSATISDLAKYKYFYVYNDRILTESEVLSLHQDPYQFLIPVIDLQDSVHAALFGETEASTDVFFQNTLHKIESGMVAQTASSLNGVLIT